jgi:hypothetical protein
MRAGFRPYGVRDLHTAVAAGRYDIAENDIEVVWGQQMWMLVGGLKDALERPGSGPCERVLIETIMRAMGATAARAREIASRPVPKLPPPNIDFSFVHASRESD